MEAWDHKTFRKPTDSIFVREAFCITPPHVFDHRICYIREDNMYISTALRIRTGESSASDRSRLMQSGHDAKQPVPKWVPVVLVCPWIQLFCLSLIVSIAVGGLHGSSERAHCFDEASASVTGFEQGPATEAKSWALTDLTHKSDHCCICCPSGRTNSGSKNSKGGSTRGPPFQRRVVLGKSIWDRHRFCHNWGLCGCLGRSVFTRSAKRS